MKPDHDKLIDDLVADLRPVRRAGRIGTSAGRVARDRILSTAC